MSTYWSAHTHSKYSAKDALPEVSAIVDRVASMGQPALGLTDHGNMGGAFQLYRECRKAGIEPLPGVEAYLTFDRTYAKSTWHAGMLALSERGYRNLVGLSNLAHERYYRKPLLDFAELAQLSEDGLLADIAVLSGCHYGVLHRILSEGSARSAESVLTALDRWFGGGCYVEIQHHDRDEYEEEALNDALLAVANAVGLPVVITQDSHYVHAEDQRVHDFMKRLGSWSDDPDDATFPGSPYCLVGESWMRGHHSERVFDAGIAGLADLLGKASVRIPEMDTFTVFIPDTPGVDDPDSELRTRVYAALDRKIESGVVAKSKRGAYVARLEEELDILEHAGFASYLLFTQMVCRWMADRDILTSSRGSASGSLTCWLLDVTVLDPVKWGIDFGRFLTKDRTKPPDIDVEVEDDRRAEVVSWLAETFPASQIGTWSTWRARGQEDDEEDQARGSIVRDYLGMVAKTGGSLVNGKIPHDDFELIQALSEFGPYKSYGVHASGVLVAPDEQVMGLVPKMIVKSSDTMVTSFDMDDIEALGLMKVDLLGSKALTVMRDLQRSTGIDRWDVPLNDRATYAAMGNGATIGCFQLEGRATRSGLKSLKPSNINDVIAAMALFRPAPMNSGATSDYVSRKHGAAQVPQRHQILMGITAKTYGVVLYQEQMMDVLRAIGMSREDLNRFLKAIKASNANVGNAAEVIAGYNEVVMKLAIDAGMSHEDCSWLWSQVLEFAGYSFNLAHATAYGLLAYQSAWFRVNHPVQFWTAMLSAYSSGGTLAKSHDTYLRAAREDKVTVRQPHVNHSGAGYRADGDAIRKGLVSIPGVGAKAAEEIAAHAPYTSVMDLIDRTNNRLVTGCASLKKGHSLESAGGVMSALFAAGALAGLDNDVPSPVRKRKAKKEAEGEQLLVDLKEAECSSSAGA